MSLDEQIPTQKYTVKILEQLTQSAFTCSKLTIEKLEKVMKYVQVKNEGT